jgi:plastocyanin
MKDYRLRAGGRLGRHPAWMGSALVGLLLMAAPARAEQPRPTPAPDRAAPAASVRVEIKEYEYLPATLTVPAGTTVTWTSHDDEPHTVTSPEKVFASPGLDADEAFSFTFSTPGTYTYYCTLHPQMTGTIIVK